MNQIPNTEEIVEKMLAIGWDSKLKKHDGTSIVVSFTKAELCDLLLNIEENHHQQLQKARAQKDEEVAKAVLAEKDRVNNQWLDAMNSQRVGDLCAHYKKVKNFFRSTPKD